MPEDFTEKELIFSETVRLFAEKGYKYVPLREVGKANFFAGGASD